MMISACGVPIDLASCSQNYSKLTLTELRTHCQALGLDASGKKADLCARLSASASSGVGAGAIQEAAPAVHSASDTSL